MPKSITSFCKSVIGFTKASLYLYHLLLFGLLHEATKCAFGPLSPIWVITPYKLYINWGISFCMTNWVISKISLKSNLTSYIFPLPLFNIITNIFGLINILEI